jgi:glycosyltransferase involved in cell wall biosynthesis
LRILLVTAGAGGMYCGSCVRDNALATQLMARGCDVSLLPVYTPTLTDEANVSGDRVFFGGVSVYLEQKVPLFRHTPALLDRIWDSAPVIRALAGRSVSVDPASLGELTVSTLRGEGGFQGKEIRKLVRWLRQQPAFDVINLPNALLISLAAPLKAALGRPVCVTLQGEDLFLEGLPEPHRSESMRLIAEQSGGVDAYISVSDYYSDYMAGYLKLPRERIHTVPLGINLEGHAPRPEPETRPFTLGYFARIAPEKGLDVLAAVYRILRRDLGLPPSRLEAAGYLSRDHEPYLAKVERDLAEWGLRDEFRYHGVVDRSEKIRFLQGLDVLCVPSPYAEPKGLYLLEALANGVPVVSPRHGSFPEVIERTGGGVLAEPGRPESFAEQILGLWRDPERRRQLGRRGAEGARKHYGAARMAERALEVYSTLAATRQPAPR